jgi:hypothetical protein
MAGIQSPARMARHGLRRLLRSRSARRADRMRLKYGPLFPGDPGSPAGVREPRRPKPTLPADAVALDIPREESARD